MSYCYDVMSKIFREHIYHLLVKEGKEHLALRFDMLIQDMHNANHNVPSADGVFSGDGINKDPRVERAAHELEECAKKLEEKKKEGG